jgi:precorrin-2 dehydrogenase/sirohydrochlorin ferrochelatase
MFPLVVDLSNRSVVVIGAGGVGARKTAQLLESGARVTVIAEEILAPVPEGVETLLVRRYVPGDLAGALLVVAATGDPAVNDQIAKEATERNVLLNVVDDLGRSDFHFTAVHRDGDVVVSVSTSGASPALAQWVRNTAAKALPKNLSSVARQLRAERSAIHAAGESTEDREWMARVNELTNEL